MVAYFTSFSFAERQTIFSVFGLMVLGAIVGHWALADLQPVIATDHPALGTLWQVAASMCGALSAAKATRGFFGGTGARGIFWTLVGAVVLTLAYGVIAGTLILPIYGTMFAPWFVLLTLGGMPILGVLWCAGLVGYHVARARYEAERDTIFDAVPSGYGDAI